MSENGKTAALIDKAAAGDAKAMEELIREIEDDVFNLSLRMLGGFEDAQDASQEILIKVISGLADFKKQSAFSTWVFRVAVNHLKNYRRHMFAQRLLSFEMYGEDILNANTDVPDMTGSADRALLAEELKMSCTNVMLQCLDAEARCIFILGTMFAPDSRIAGEILGITPEAYRQRLSRARKRMAEFLSEYCGEYGNGKCRCKDRVNYAVTCHRINPQKRDFTEQTLKEVKRAMEDLDELSDSFEFMKTYKSPERMRKFVKEFISSEQLIKVTEA